MRQNGAVAATGTHREVERVKARDRDYEGRQGTLDDALYELYRSRPVLRPGYGCSDEP